jgi:N,N'-diacetyllegionaminate synthase
MDNIIYKEPFVIAEIGNNHEGNFEVAKKLVYEAKKAGVDAVKFQVFDTENYVNKSEQERYSKLKGYELSRSNFFKLSQIAKSLKLKFISTPFDMKSAEFLSSVVDLFKISSGDNNYYDLIAKVMSYKKKTLISTGLINYSDIKKLIFFIRKKKFLLKNVCFLHCVSSYPTEDKNANLLNIKYLRDKLRMNVGYSDHTLGITAPLVAYSLGANVIEKHFTLDNNFSSFRDHKISLDPLKMKTLVIELKKAYLCMGQYVKKISNSEKKNLKAMRRSVYLNKDIEKNTKITLKDLKVVRPFKVIEPNDIKFFLNKKVKKKLLENHAISKKNVI